MFVAGMFVAGIETAGIVIAGSVNAGMLKPGQHDRLVTVADARAGASVSAPVTMAVRIHFFTFACQVI